MTKRNRIIYWVATIWLALGMTSTAIVQLIQLDEEVTNFTTIGFPIYLMTLIGVLKLLGVMVILLPKLPLLKEWAYAGFFFTMLGATYAHLAVNDDPISLFGPILLCALTLLSWYFRPLDRKLKYINQ